MLVAALLAMLVGQPIPESKDSEPTMRDWHIARSAFLCALEPHRLRSIEAIRRERKYAADLSGVVDVVKLHRWQDEVKNMDEQEESVRRSLRRDGLKALPCSDARVVRAAACVRVSSIEGGAILVEWRRRPACLTSEMKRIASSTSVEYEDEDEDE